MKSQKLPTQNTLTQTDLAFTRTNEFNIETLRVLRFTHLQSLKNEDSTEEAVLEALEKAVSLWIETTPTGLAAWQESCENFNIGDFCTHYDFQLQASLEAHGIHSIETLFELSPNQEVAYDKVLAQPDLEPDMLYREDGEQFSRNEDGSYSMDNSHMVEPYKYSYHTLMETGNFFRTNPKTPLPSSKKKCQTKNGKTPSHDPSP
jgi:hypothetical protein